MHRRRGSVVEFLPMSLPVAHYRFTVDEYYRLAEVGILDQDDRVELIEGEIVMMSPIGGRHAASVACLTHLLVEAVGRRALVRVQSPVVLDDFSEPEPDVCLARSRADSYASGHPRPADVLLLVEVADSSASYDRTVKLPLYSRAGIQTVWILDLGRDLVEVYSAPSPDGYLAQHTGGAGDRLEVPGSAATIDVSELFPR